MLNSTQFGQTPKRVQSYWWCLVTGAVISVRDTVPGHLLPLCLTCHGNRFCCFGLVRKICIKGNRGEKASQALSIRTESHTPTHTRPHTHTPEQPHTPAHPHTQAFTRFLVMFCQKSTFKSREYMTLRAAILCSEYLAKVLKTSCAFLFPLFISKERSNMATP